MSALPASAAASKRAFWPASREAISPWFSEGLNSWHQLLMQSRCRLRASVRVHHEAPPLPSLSRQAHGSKPRVRNCRDPSVTCVICLINRFAVESTLAARYQGIIRPILLGPKMQPPDADGIEARMTSIEAEEAPLLFPAKRHVGRSEKAPAG